MTIEDEFTNEELDTLQAQWNQKELEERELLFNTIIAHHELDKIRGSNTAMAYAENNGLKSEFEQYLKNLNREEMK